MLSYLDKHKDMFFEMIAKGIALPIYLFAFRKVDNNSNENLERCDNDSHIFIIEQYLEEVHNKEK